MARHTKGSVLIMAIIMGSGMLVVAVEMSMFVASTIRQARSIDRTLVAQYAVESAVENALHQIRKEERTILREDTRTGLVLYTIDGRDAQWTFEKDCPTCPERFSPTVQKITKSRLGEQQSLDVHLWTHADGQFAAQPSDFVTMKVAWRKADCGEDETPWIETTAMTLAVPDTQLRWNDGDARVKKDFQRPADGANNVTVQLSSLMSDGGDSLSMRIKPFFCSLRDVEISFPKEGSPTELVPIPNYYLIRPSVAYGDVTKELSVIMPRLPGLAGIFDYLLFSDEKIEKVEK